MGKYSLDLLLSLQHPPKMADIDKYVFIGVLYRFELEMTLGQWRLVSTHIVTGTQTSQWAELVFKASSLLFMEVVKLGK